MNDYYAVIRSDSYLAHHGVKGMKWGVRHDDRPKGRKRKGFLSLFKKKKRSKQKSSKMNMNDFDAAVSKDISKSDKIQKLKEDDENFNRLGNELAGDWDKYYKSLRNNSSFKKDVYDGLHKELGVGCDDEDLFEMTVSDVVDDVSQRKRPSNLVNKEKEFYRYGDSYFKDIDYIISSISEKYKNVDVKTSAGTKKGKDVVAGAVHDNVDSRFNSYMYKHYEDYWVNDVDSKYDLENLFDMDTYNKKYSKG